MAQQTNPSFNNNLAHLAESHFYGIKGLTEELDLEALPHHYVLPPDERFGPKEALIHNDKSLSIPMIDVSDWSDPQVKASICMAASTWGFFQIVNHGVPVEVLEKVKDAASASFNLQMEEKKKYWKGNSMSATAFMGTNMGMSNGPFEWKDFLKIEFLAGEEEKVSASWPSVLKDPVMDYLKKAEPVIKTLLLTLLDGLNANENDEAREKSLISARVVAMNYIPKCPKPELAAAALCHVDVSTITMLIQGNNNALCVRSPYGGDKWAHVHPMREALVINVGDLLQIMSNSKYKSVNHRMMPLRTEPQISVNYFIAPQGEASVRPFKEVMESGAKPIYREILVSDYAVLHQKCLDEYIKSPIDYLKMQ